MITFVGVGPGDPELVTRKAVGLLRECDGVAQPDTGLGKSAVMGIIGDLVRDKPVLSLPMPMCGGREDWIQAHERAAETLLPFSVERASGDRLVRDTFLLLKMR